MTPLSTVFIVLTSLLIHPSVAIKGKDPLEVPGVVLLDSITFPKLIPNSDFCTLVLFANKALIGEPGTDSIRDHFLGLPIGLL